MSRARTFLDEAGAVFGFCHEQIPGKGEDSCCYRIHEQGGILGVFDGCGGLGAQSYARFGGHSGAYMASRAVAAASMKWCEGQRAKDPIDIEALKGCIAEAFSVCDAVANEPQTKLRGAMVRPFPTTMSLFYFRHAMKKTTFTAISAGDSRLYLLDAGGLKQLNRDDLAGEDAFSNLYHDAPMTNVVSSDGDYELSKNSFVLTNACVLLAATDGCFGYLPSPMDFEWLLLSTLFHSQSVDQWQERLEDRIQEIAGDDYTLMGLVYGCESFDGLQDFLYKRYEQVRGIMEDLPDGVEPRRQLWESYKQDYYALALGGVPAV